jgi:hypothetical protein
MCLSSSTTIVDQVTPGKHVLHCEVVEETNDKLSGGHEFRITSVTALVLENLPIVEIAF